MIEQEFGFNRATPRTFIMDRVKGLLLAAVIGLPLGAAILWIFGNVANAWLWAWLTVTAFQLILTYLAPSLIMPLFNKFTPMPDGELKQEIEELGDKCGFPLTGVFVMDGSKRSTKANAFFTGLGKRKKIALFDTLVEKSTRPELHRRAGPRDRPFPLRTHQATAVRRHPANRRHLLPARTRHRSRREIRAGAL